MPSRIFRKTCGAKGATLKDRARNDRNEYVRWAAVHELARGWRTDPETLPFLEVKE